MRYPNSDKDTAKRLLAAKGFGTFQNWKKQNLEGQRINKAKGRMSLVRALEEEYERYIKSNL